VTVWNRPAPATDTLGAAGGAVASSAAVAVRSKEVVVTMLSGPDRIEQVVRDADLPFAPEALAIDATTVAPADSADVDLATP
jgi:3-hydroxyisobutyrate dehydrogenase-like beta-hydroxyacid dehydrogenase